jgi:hypothetical protein
MGHLFSVLIIAFFPPVINNVAHKRAVFSQFHFSLAAKIYIVTEESPFPAHLSC